MEGPFLRSTSEAAPQDLFTATSAHLPCCIRTQATQRVAKPTAAHSAQACPSTLLRHAETLFTIRGSRTCPFEWTLHRRVWRAWAGELPVMQLTSPECLQECPAALHGLYPGDLPAGRKAMHCTILWQPNGLKVSCLLLYEQWCLGPCESPGALNLPGISSS